MGDKAWHRAKSVVGESREGGARPPTEEEQQDAEWLAERVAELIKKLSGIGFHDASGFFFIAEVAMELNFAEKTPNWSTKAGGIRAVKNILQGHAVLDWGYVRIQAACDLIESDLI